MKLFACLILILSFYKSSGQSTYTWPAGQVNLPNPTAGFNPITNLPNPPPSTKDTVITNGDTLFLALAKTGTTSTSITGGPLVWNMDISGANTNYSQLTITLKQYAVGMKFCLTGMNCNSYRDKIVVIGVNPAGGIVKPTITGDSLTIVDSTASAVCGSGEIVIGSIGSPNAKVKADKVATVDFGSIPIKQVILRFYNGSGGVNPPPQSIGICDLQYSKTLPLNLLSFKSFQDENKILLKWKTDSEINVANFEVQKSNDGKSFENIASLNPTIKNSKNVNEYNYYDTKPYEGINYYRLKIINYDNTYEYSKIVSHIYNSGTFQFKAFPNPLPIFENLQIKNVSEIKELFIYDITGKAVPFRIINNEVQFNQPGVYNLKAVTILGQTKTIKIIVR